MKWRACALLVLLSSALLARAGEPQPAVLCDFETGEPADGWSAKNLTMAEIATPHGRGLTLTGQDTAKGSSVGWVHRASGVRDWRSYSAFSMQVRVESKEPIAMRVQAIRPGGAGRLLRRFTVEPGDWRELVLPLKDFRDDGEDQAGSFANVDRILLRWDKGTGDVSIDDLRLLPGDRGPLSCTPTAQDWLRLGFPDGKARHREGENFLLLDDAAALSDEDAKRLLDRIEEGLKLLADRYGVAGDLGGKVPFFVFATREEYEGFVGRLGDHFGATVAAPKSDGFSVFGAGMSTYDATKGWDRPVFVHEALHGAIHRRLGVASDGNWIQEGLANAVQAQLHPGSLDRARLAERFEKRDGSIAPWSKLFEQPRAPMSAYPQLVSVMDFLAEKHGAMLPRVWETVRGLREPLHSAAPAAVAKTLGVDLKALEDEYVAWGADYYGKKAR